MKFGVTERFDFTARLPGHTVAEQVWGLTRAEAESLFAVLEEALELFEVCREMCVERGFEVAHTWVDLGAHDGLLRVTGERSKEYESAAAAAAAAAAADADENFHSPRYPRPSVAYGGGL